MCLSHELLDEAYKKYQQELVQAGLLLPSGVQGVYGLSGVFENIIEKLENRITFIGRDLQAEVVRFPPVINRQTYLATDHIETFPDLMGSIHSFCGDEKSHLEMIQKKHNNQDWTQDLSATEVMMVPAACYPLYPTAANTVLDENGRVVDLRAFVFRHEPSPDPARMQIFRQREYVRLGTPDQALEHRNMWLDRAEKMLLSLGLDVQPVVANDPFFGRGGRVMAASQKEQELKYELVAPVASTEKLTAITSSNYHLDHFGTEFNITTANGEPAHTACVGFGLERITLALLKKHGFDPDKWPAAVRNILEL